MDSPLSRRQLVQTAGAAGVASLAGCTQLRSSDDPDETDPDGTDQNGNETDTEPDREPSIDPADGLTAVVEPDEEAQAELAAREQELMQEIQDEEISQQEAQAELMEMQAEFNGEAIDELDAYAEDVDELTVDGTITQFGLVLLDGSDEALVATLSDEAVSALLPGTEFEEFQNPPQQEQP